MLKNIYFFSNNQIINISLYLSFIVLYFFHFDYVLSHRDEIYYLADSLLLIEGYKPTFSHSPSGLSTWLGSIYVLIDFVVKNIFSLNSAFSINQLFTSFDLHLANHYQDLRGIKISLILLNSVLLFYLLFLSKNNLFLIFFLLLFTQPFFINLSLSGTPYFLASLLLIISLVTKESKPFISIIFYGLCVAERVEYILFLFIFLNKGDFKQNLKTLGLFLLVFLTTAPWFLFSFLQNIKVLVTYIASSAESVVDKDNNLLKYAKYISILLYCILTVTLTVVKKRNKMFLLILLLTIILYFLIFMFQYPLRWFMPLFVYLFYLITMTLDKKNIKNLNIYLSIPIVVFVIFFLFENKESESEILIKQINLKKDIIGLPLLREQLNFNEFSKIWGDHLFIKNIKNIKYFGGIDAPIVFGETGNLEQIQFRRYQYISKYFYENKYKKYIYGKSGLYFNEYHWCELLESNKPKKVYYFNSKNYTYINCDELP